ncbi:MAG: hypothetical protein ACI9R3_000801 [Verrucomicrobiales bacterium]|jgi:hypothetical protein
MRTRSFAATLLTLTFLSTLNVGGQDLNRTEVDAHKESIKSYATENLVAWCIVPFDAKKRSPEARSKMLIDLGIKRCAYDWRKEHVPQFEDEILQYQKHGIDFFAFWGEHDSAFALFEEYDLHPQIWITAPSPSLAGDSQEEKIAAAVAQLTPLVERAKALKCPLGLYNHGGWGGEPTNLAAVSQAFSAAGHDHVGIVYNFHHGHDHIDDFAPSLKQMLPYLHCLNLNGMADANTVSGITNKILPIGSGKHESRMIQAIIDSGYSGPIGILDHIDSQDAALSLKNNIDGLKRVLADLK